MSHNPRETSGCEAHGPGPACFPSKGDLSVFGRFSHCSDSTLNVPISGQDTKWLQEPMKRYVWPCSKLVSFENHPKKYLCKKKPRNLRSAAFDVFVSSSSRRKTHGRPVHI